MQIEDIAGLIHPLIAVAFVFPIIGIVTNYAWQTRQRRLSADKSKIAPSVGTEHLRLGRLLSNAVVMVSLVGLAHPIVFKMIASNAWGQEPLRVVFVGLMFGLSIVSLFGLNRAKNRLWRGVFATLTGMGIILLGSQPEVFRRGFEWYVSHYYYGVAVALLMIFSLAIFPDIYRDRKNRWRNVHIILSCLAILLFIGQGFTGSRDLLEIPLSWQKAHIQECDFQKLTCP
ncbi:DUF4079 domain-containing protein [Pseudanabaenaceae cyanobacterium LEGE 13415]|nr:DUF4079 domain-containing protein [Pseudanabaenaceae cyanobacterium LEGE 13415]